MYGEDGCWILDQSSQNRGLKASLQTASTWTVINFLSSIRECFWWFALPPFLLGFTEIYWILTQDSTLLHILYKLLSFPPKNYFTGYSACDFSSVSLSQFIIMDSIEAWLDFSLSHFIKHKEAIALDLLIQPCILKMMSQTLSLKLAVPNLHQLLLTLYF